MGVGGTVDRPFPLKGRAQKAVFRPSPRIRSCARGRQLLQGRTHPVQDSRPRLGLNDDGIAARNLDEKSELENLSTRRETPRPKAQARSSRQNFRPCFPFTFFFWYSFCPCRRPSRSHADSVADLFSSISCCYCSRSPSLTSPSSCLFLGRSDRQDRVEKGLTRRLPALSTAQNMVSQPVSIFQTLELLPHSLLLLAVFSIKSSRWFPTLFLHKPHSSSTLPAHLAPPSPILDNTSPSLSSSHAPPPCLLDLATSPLRSTRLRPLTRSTLGHRHPTGSTSLAPPRRRLSFARSTEPSSLSSGSCTFSRTSTGTPFSPLHSTYRHMS